ncbi:MAG: hypothetical protein V2B18_01545, partial [Pseudomonadota bacterium]
QVALAHRIMTQYTSFVAVEEAIVTIGGKPVTVPVPVEMPDGVDRKGVFGNEGQVVGQAVPSAPLRMKVSRSEIAIPGSTAASAPVSGAPDRSAFKNGPSAHAKREARGMAFGRAVPEKEAAAKLEKRPEESKQARIDSTSSADEEADKKKDAIDKLAPRLRELLGRKDKGGTYQHGKIKVEDGKVTVQVRLSAGTEDVLKRLKEKGFELSFQASAGKVVIGVISVDKLEELIKLAEVLNVEPVEAG